MRHYATTLVFTVLILTAAAIDSTVNDSELKIDYLTEPLGCENPVKIGDIVTIGFQGFLGDETPMHFMPNSSYEFRVGFSQVIKGWTLGVLGMCVGDSRKLTIPPHLAYGSKGAQPTVPPNAVLIFNITLQNRVDGIQDAIEDLEDAGSADLNNNQNLDGKEFASIMFDYLKNLLTNDNRGSYIYNGVKTKVK